VQQRHINFSSFYFRAMRETLGDELRQQYEVTGPAPQGLVELLDQLDTRVREATRERLYSAVEQSLAAMARAGGRKTGNPVGTEEP
jgi:hypothetical protein